MKRILLLTVVVGLFASVSMADIYYSPDLSIIQGMTKTWDAAGCTSSVPTVTTVAGEVTFAANLQNDPGTQTGSFWASMGIGYGWPEILATPASNLSAYDGYALTFKNTNNSNWFVNLYMNTGWTGSGETNQFSQNGWTEIAPGSSATLVLDFSDEGVLNTNHVTNIGFQVGGNMTNPFWSPNPSNPDNFHVTVSQVPVPAALLLGLLGLSAAGVKLRKFA